MKYVLDTNTLSFLMAGVEKMGARLEAFDVAVAAHALTLDATLVTDNVDHMKRVDGLKLENWRAQPESPG